MTRPSRRWLAMCAPIAALATLFALAIPAWASTVQIQDDAHVLNATTVQNDAASLPVPVYIWSTTQDANSTTAFDTDVQNKVSTNFPIVIGINTASHHMAVRIGSAARLSQSAANAASSTANSAFDGSMRGNHDYTTATVAAIDNLRGSLTSANRGRTTTTSTATRSAGGGILMIVLLVVGLIVVVAVIGGLRRAFRPSSGPTMVAGPPPMAPYPGYGPQYPTYGPQYQSGMSPGGAGMLGAVGGGLLGYELGKMAGEREQARDDEFRYEHDRAYQNDSYDQGDNWVVGTDSDFGGGFDSGGGGSDNSGSGDW